MNRYLLKTKITHNMSIWSHFSYFSPILFVCVVIYLHFHPTVQILPYVFNDQDCKFNRDDSLNLFFLFFVKMFIDRRKGEGLKWFECLEERCGQNLVLVTLYGVG